MVYAGQATGLVWQPNIHFLCHQPMILCYVKPPPVLAFCMLFPDQSDATKTVVMKRERYLTENCLRCPESTQWDAKAMPKMTIGTSATERGACTPPNLARHDPRCPDVCRSSVGIPLRDHALSTCRQPSDPSESHQVL